VIKTLAAKVRGPGLIPVDGLVYSLLFTCITSCCCCCCFLPFIHTCI